MIYATILSYHPNINKETFYVYWLARYELVKQNGKMFWSYQNNKIGYNGYDAKPQFSYVRSDLQQNEALNDPFLIGIDEDIKIIYKFNYLESHLSTYLNKDSFNAFRPDTFAYQKS